MCVKVSHVSHFLLRKQEAQSYADDNSLLFMETSAKTSMNVNEILNKMVLVNYKSEGLSEIINIK